jgi:hypothetical protein
MHSVFKQSRKGQFVLYEVGGPVTPILDELDVVLATNFTHTGDVLIGSVLGFAP